MAATTDGLSPVMDVDGVPNDEAVGYLLVGLVIGSLEGSQCTIRKDHPPAIGHVRRVAFNNRNVVFWVCFFEQQAAIETCWPATKDDYLHCGLLQGYAINATWAMWVLSTQTIENICQLLELVQIGHCWEKNEFIAARLLIPAHELGNGLWTGEEPSGYSLRERTGESIIILQVARAGSLDMLIAKGKVSLRPELWPFFFSSRRRHTRLTCDWSSDVCSSD